MLNHQLTKFARLIFFPFAFMLASHMGICQQSQTDTPGTYNILTFGAKADGKTVNTIAIQNTINECRGHGGGTIIIPAGIFVTGTVRLYSNMSIYLSAGAVLTGSTDNKDYLYQKEFGFSGPGAGVKTGIIVASKAQNVSITGFGTIDGNGTSSMHMDSLQQGSDFDKKYTRQGSDYMNADYGREDGPVLWKGSYEERPGVMVIFSECKNVIVNNIKLQQSPNWTIAFLSSDEIKVAGITIDNNMNIPNSDGIDMYDSRNITISNCVINAGDDAIAVVSSSNITATNCMLHSRSCGIRVGYNVFNNNNSGNLLFNNITIYDSNRGIGIFQRQKGNMERMIFSNIIIDTRLHSGQWWGHGEPIHISSVPGLGSKETGTISNVRFSNISASSESGIVLYAASKDLIKNVYFDHINLTIKKSALEKGYGGNFDLRPVNNIALGIFNHNISALYARFVTNLNIRNLDVTWNPGLPSYFDHAIACDNSTGITIDGVHESLANAGAGGNAATVYLSNDTTVSVEHISSTDKNKKLVSDAVRDK